MFETSCSSAVQSMFGMGGGGEEEGEGSHKWQFTVVLLPGLKHVIHTEKTW